MELSSSLFASVDFVNLNESDLFSSQLEILIRRWKLSLTQLDDLMNDQERDCSRFESVRCFNLSFRIHLIENDDLRAQCDYKQLLDNVLHRIREVNYTYPEETNFIQKFHGLTNFILIQTENRLDVLESQQIIKLINSAISCSITNTKCIYPIFVQIKDQIFELSTGTYINFGIRINYDSAIFDLNQLSASTIDEFLKIFENKLKCNLQLDDNVRCFLANRRCLNNYLLKPDQQDNLLVNLADNLEKEFKDLNLIGHLENLCFQIKHTETLPKIQGTQWIFNAEESILKDFLKLENGCFSIRIDHLEKSSIYRSSYYGQELVEKLPKEYLQLKRVQLQNLDEYRLFCTGNFESKQNYLTYFLVKSGSCDEFIDSNQAQFKSAPFDSIIFRFASFIFNIYSTRLNDLISDEPIGKKIYFEISDYWSAIVDQLRRYWELCEMIPCVEDRLPDLNSCLLLQKIQLLNCCIKEKQQREGSNLDHIKEESKEEEDEFFDCQTDLSGDEPAEGRLEKLKLTLLNNKMKSIYKPITQRLTPYTEDNRDEYLKAYSGMNFDDEISENVETDQFVIGKNILLVSDMGAFKAANPECCFEDFIHWYSPKDFIEADYDELTGTLLSREELSERFRTADCLWRKIWQASKAVPVCRQKRIFNYSMEAERVLDFLNTIKFDDLMRYLFSTFVQIGCLKYKQIVDHSLFKSPELFTYFNRQIKQIANRSKMYDLVETSSLLIELDKKVFDHLSLIYILRYTSFSRANHRQLNNENLLYERNDGESSNKTNDKQLNDKQLNEILDEIAKNKFYRIRKDEEMGSIVFNGLNRLFNLDNLRQLDTLIVRSKEKEFTFVADCSRPANYSRKLPQKLNFKLSSTEASRKWKVRMNGQFSENYF